MPFCSVEDCMGKMTVASTYIECASEKWCHLIEFGESFLDIERLQRPQVAVYERSFEHPTLLVFHCFIFEISQMSMTDIERRLPT